MYHLLEMYQGKCFLVEEVFEGAGVVPGQLNKHTYSKRRVFCVFPCPPLSHRLDAANGNDILQLLCPHLLVWWVLFYVMISTLHGLLSSTPAASFPR